MKQKLVNIYCPNCKSSKVLVKESLILATIETNIKEEILQFKHLNHKCLNCNNTISYSYPFIYYDSNYKFVIGYNTVVDSTQYNDITIYNTNDYKELYTIIKCYDLNIDFNKFIILMNKLDNNYYLYDRDDDYLIFKYNNEFKLIDIKYLN